MQGLADESREGGCRRAGTGPARRLRLPLLDQVSGLAHAFTVSGSDREQVLRAEAGRTLPTHQLRQVHGARVHVVVDRKPDAPPAGPPEGDALITARRGVALSIQVADCVPALLCDPRSGQIGAVHAGWRGTVAGVLGTTIRALQEGGARPADLLVGFGPSIGRCCFEVGPEVVSAFLAGDPGGGDCLTSSRASRVHLDLVEANRRQALEHGIQANRIAASGLCTVCRPDLLESYRRGRGASGRMAALIAWKP